MTKTHGTSVTVVSLSLSFLILCPLSLTHAQRFLGTEAKAASPTAQRARPQVSVLITADAGKGLVLSGGFDRRNGKILFGLTFENRSVLCIHTRVRMCVCVCVMVE